MSWASNNNGSDKVSIIVQDYTGRKIDTIKASADDPLLLAKLLNDISLKYGLGIKVTIIQDKKPSSWLDTDEELKW